MVVLATTSRVALPLLRASAASWSLSPRVPSAPLATAAASTQLAAVPSLVASTLGAAVAVPPLARDVSVSIFLVIASVMWIKICNGLAGAGVTSQYVSRKLVHMGSGPLFLLFWPFFSTAASAQLCAIAVPVLSLLRLWRAGKAKGAGSELVKAISRSGDKKEALEGPFLYTIVLLLATTLGWRSPLSIIVVCQMAIGDGMADIIGRRFGKTRWPKAMEPSGKKSVEGSLAFAGFAFAASLGMLGVNNLAGITSIDLGLAAPRLALISLIASAVELLPLGDDNLTVPGSSAIAAILLFRGF